ncbi:MAG: sarcosine oxidase subunit delta [Planctomycetota bacterium]|nr:sarcosine oxidase subunit delta [Planctomycetota bacterium]
MAFQIECPNCGVRPAWEFHYGGATRNRPEPQAPSADWVEYIYSRPNTRGEESEWWYHRSACKLWFLAERDTNTNHVLETRRFEAQENVGG